MKIRNLEHALRMYRHAIRMQAAVLEWIESEREPANDAPTAKRLTKDEARAVVVRRLAERGEYGR